ncbi:MAG TPA: hypothetical protein VLT36_18865, partial [Candidatus Dormibacteraeota bacterium]|nr:hypothetical protein [Candidatus Dormibacteraeota bacterium]
MLFVSAESSSAQTQFAFTQQAAPVRASNATLNGMVVPRGNPTVAWFEWGIDRTYGNVTATQNVGNGSGTVRVTNQLTGLMVGGIYHFRVVASNSTGV